MYQERITLPEFHPDYPSLWESPCGKARIIRCPDDLQYIVQGYRTPKWRNLSYHTEWWSISFRWGNEQPFKALPEAI